MTLVWIKTIQPRICTELDLKQVSPIRDLSIYGTYKPANTGIIKGISPVYEVDSGITLQKREGVDTSGGALKPLPQLCEPLAVYFTGMGDVVLIDLGDGVFIGRVPNTSLQSNETPQCNRGCCCDELSPQSMRSEAEGQERSPG